ncbi:MAG: rhodanese-related sulfurtransferase [Verrucomicrobia bacterium]|nr:rhodanese-related sulfurtransferase [Verrucomicrobiota bacterium]
MKKYIVVSYYKYTPIEDPVAEVTRHKAFVETRDMTGRIYYATEGVNAQFSGEETDIREYLAWIEEDPRFQGVLFKCQEASENVFPRMTIKVRPYLVALGEKTDLSLMGEYVSSPKWKEMLEEDDQEYLKIDVRNDYEWDVGRFRNFLRPQCRTFRDFVTYTRELKEKVDPKNTKVMMCCTGGIRCEVYSALMRQEGFETVYQLEGGILKYAEEEKGSHFEGKLFVFDDRLAVEVNRDNPQVVGKCHHCSAPIEKIYNCANMDCNNLFLCCPSCLETLSGCCSSSCQQAPRLRELDESRLGKPFRRMAKIRS